MKYRFVFALISIGLLTNCQQSKENNTPTLSVTIDPQKYFLETIVGDKYAVESIVPSGANPENFDVAPSRMISIEKSIAYFKVGYLGIENTLIDKMVLNNSNIKVINCSQGISPIQGDDEHHHEHGEECNHGGGHNGTDPHIWTSVATARIIADNMYKAVVTLDSANVDVYTKNYTKLTDQFSETDRIIKSYLAKAPSKSFIIYHPSLSYFAQEYGLEQIPIEFEGKTPSPNQLKELIDLAKNKNIKIIFIQQEFDVKNAETIANSIGAKTVVINQLSYDWSSEMIKIAKALALE